MKKSRKKTAIVIALLCVAVIVTGGMIMHHHLFAKETPITSFTAVTLRLSGMRLTEEYEVICRGETAEITHYTMNYADGRETRLPEKTAVCDSQTVIEKLNEFGVLRWDGFHGKHPRGVTDGTMFTLTATVNCGEEIREIHADGSENFPKHFHDFCRWLSDTVREKGEG